MKLNYLCDFLAKISVNNAIMDSNVDRGGLRLESGCIFIGRDKPTRDVSKDLWHCVGRKESGEFCVGKGILDQSTYDKSDNRILLPIASIIQDDGLSIFATTRVPRGNGVQLSKVMKIPSISPAPRPLYSPFPPSCPPCPPCPPCPLPVVR